MAKPWERYSTNAVSKNGPWTKYAVEDDSKTFNRFESGALGVRSGASLGTSDEAEGGKAARLKTGPAWFNRGMAGVSSGLPVVQAVGGLIDAGIGLTVENTQPADSEARKAYTTARDVTRNIQDTAREDNPVSYFTGELTGAIATGPPLATAGRSTAVVAAQKASKAAELTKRAATATGAGQKALQARAAKLSADAARLAKPAQTAAEMTGRVARIAGEGALKGGAVGGAYGAAYGFGSSEGDNLADRGQDAALGGALGAAGGAILTPIVQAFGAAGGGLLYKMKTPAEVKALDMVLRRAERSGTDLNAVKAQFDQWAKTGEVPETLAELMGPSERSLLSALVTVNRETREQATNVFVGRGREEVNRLEDAFARSFGAGRGDYQKTRVAAAEARAKEAEPFYEGAYIDVQTGQRKFLGQPETDQLAYEIGGSRVAQSTLSTASDYADALGKRAIRDEIDDFAKAIRAGGPIKPLSIEAADYIERGINRRLKAASSGEALDIPGGIASLRNRIRGIIDPSGLGEARATAAEAIRRGELLDQGLDIMKPSVDVDDVNAVMRGIPEAGIDPASDAGRTAYGVGASRAIANELRNVPDMGGFADATRKVARTPALRDKLEAARPKVLTKKGAENKGSKQTKANLALDEAIERASNRSQFGVDMVGNSKTAFRQGDVEDAVLDDGLSTQIGESLSDLLIAGAGGASDRLRERMSRAIGNRIGQPSIYRPKINRAAAEILLATGDQIPVQIKRLASRAAQRANQRLGIRAPTVPPQGGGTPPAPGAPPRPPLSGPPAGGGTAAAGFGFNPFAKRPPVAPVAASEPMTNQALMGEYDRLLPRMNKAVRTFQGKDFESVPGGREALLETIGKANAAGKGASDDQIVEEAWQLMRRRQQNGPNWPPPRESLQPAGIDDYGPMLGKLVANKQFFEVDLDTAIRESLTDLDDMLAREGLRRGDDMVNLDQLKRYIDNPKARDANLEGWQPEGGTRANGLPNAFSQDLGRAGAGALSGGVMPLPSTGDPEQDMRNRLGLMGAMAAVGAGGPRLANAFAPGVRSMGVGGRAGPKIPAHGYDDLRIGRASVEVTRVGDGMTINRLKVPENARGQGEASRALQEVLRQADAQGLTVYLTADPVGSGGLSKAQLEAFYNRNGFISDGAGGMVRKPQSASSTLTAGLGGGGRKPPKDSPEAIRAGVQKITQKLKSKGSATAAPQQPEMRVSKGMAKVTGIADNRELGAKAARDMLTAGRSPAEIFAATNHVPMTVDGKTIMVRAAGKNPDEVTAAFWQEMAKPVSRRADWIREQTKGIKPIGPDAVARQPLETRAQVATSMIRKGGPIKPQDIWEETDMVVIMRGQDGQPVISKTSVPQGSEPVSLMDGSNFKSFNEVVDYLLAVEKLPRAQQPAWYRENFSDPLTLQTPATRLQRAGDFVQRRQNAVGATLLGGAALGGTVGVLTAKDTPESMRVKLNQPPQR